MTPKRNLVDGALSGRTIRPVNPIPGRGAESRPPRPESVTEDIQHQRELALRILELLEPGPLNEEEIGLRTGLSREQVESVLQVLVSAGRIEVSHEWTWPPQYRLVES